MYVSFIFTGLEVRAYLLKSYLGGPQWGYLEMYMLLAEDLVKFDLCHGNEKTHKHFSTNGYPDLLITLLISRCPVSQ